jgi:hypothetical protein
LFLELRPQLSSSAGVDLISISKRGAEREEMAMDDGRNGRMHTHKHQNTGITHAVRDDLDLFREELVGLA